MIVYIRAQNTNRPGTIAGIADSDEQAEEKGIVVTDCFTREGTRESLISEAENTIEYLHPKVLNSRTAFDWKWNMNLLDYLS